MIQLGQHGSPIRSARLLPRHGRGSGKTAVIASGSWGRSKLGAFEAGGVRRVATKPLPQQAFLRGDLTGPMR